MSQSPPFLSEVEPRLSRRMIWGAAWVAVLLKLICAATTIGTVDVQAFFLFGRKIFLLGLAPLYRHDPLFNHMPLVGLWSEFLYGATFGNLRSFGLLFRLPSILADLVTINALLRVVPWHLPSARWALLCLALSPVSFMVSGFHGNVDPIMTCFLVLAAVACLEKQVGRSALFFTLAVNLKAPALVLAPAFFFFWLARGAGGRFFLQTSLLTLASWAYPLAVCPREFVTHVLGYGSYWGMWGVTYWLSQSGWDRSFAGMRMNGFSNLQSLIMLALKLVIVSGSLWIAWVRRRAPGFGLIETVVGLWLLFMTFAPGVGAQYLVWPAPFLVLVWNRAYFWITAACSLHLLVFYTVICGGWPWYFGYFRPETNVIFLRTSNLPWLAFCLALAFWLHAQFRQGRSVSSETLVAAH